MPKPVYILCASDIVQDKDSNLISIFKVIEKLEVRKARVGVEGIPTTSLAPNEQVAGLYKIVAVWMKLSADDGVEFEHQFLIRVDDKEESTAMQPFAFTKGRDLSRFIMILRGFPIPEKSEFISIISRVRRTGTTDWAIQDYPIRMSVSELSLVAQAEGDAGE